MAIRILLPRMFFQRHRLHSFPSVIIELINLRGPLNFRLGCSIFHHCVEFFKEMLDHNHLLARQKLIVEFLNKPDLIDFGIVMILQPEGNAGNNGQDSNHNFRCAARVGMAKVKI